MTAAKLVVPIDFSECSRSALSWATALASRDNAPIELVHAVHVAPYPAPMEFGVPPDLVDNIEERASEQLAKWAEDLSSTGLPVSHSVSREPAVDAICAAADRSGARLIVMGTHGYAGIQRAFLGSVAERTVRMAPCPVFTAKTAPEHSERAIRRVLLCTDFSDSAERATQEAIERCREWGAELHVVHALHPVIPAYADLPPPEDFIDTARGWARGRLDKLRERIVASGLEGAVELVEGDPATAIARLENLHGLDLIVMGTRGNSGLQHVMLGSVAERVLRRVSCPVLTTRGN